MHVSTGLVLFQKLRHSNFSLSVPGLGLSGQNTSCQSICFTKRLQRSLKKKKFLYIKEDQVSVEAYSFLLTS